MTTSNAAVGTPGRSSYYIILISMIASLGGVLFGFDTAVISGTQSMVKAKFMLSEWHLGWFLSSALVGCIIGAAISGVLGDYLGRKKTLMISALLYFASAVLTAAAWDFTSLIIARMIGGVGVGIASGIVPTYISEFASSNIRGRLVAMYQLSIVIGILLAYFSNLIIQSHATAKADMMSTDGFFDVYFVTECWRGMFGMEAIPAALFFFLLFVIPESFRWLISTGKTEQARKIMGKVYDSQTVESTIAEIVSTDRNESFSLLEILKPGFRVALILAVGLSVFGQLTGINIVLYYGPEILKSAGLETGSALFYQVLIGFINLIFTLVALWKVDSWGRRPLLIYGMAGVTVTMAVAALILYLKAPPILLVIALGAYVAFIAVSICAVIWVLTPEVLPNRVRARAVSIATFANWGTNAIAAQLFPWYVDQYGMYSGFATFAAICFVGTFFFWFLVPETKGKSLEEIEKYWIRNSAGK